MKAFYISLCLFAVMIGAMVSNYRYVQATSSKMIEQLEQLPSVGDEQTLAAAIAIAQQWERVRPLVQATVNHTEIEVIGNVADELVTFAKHKNISEFERARALLINAFQELRLSELLTLSNIL